MNIIITGALGHIGSFIIRDLASQYPDSQMILIDNLMTQRYCSLFNLPKSNKFKFIEADILNYDFTKILNDNDILIHLAAITDAAGSFERAEELENNNFNSTKKVANACCESGARLITLSSTSVYGTQKLVVSEDCTQDDLKPQSPYAKTKLKEEEFVLNLSKNAGLKAVICRFGTIFGPSIGMRFHTAVNKFCWQAVMGIPITVWRTAYDQKRPYLDLVDASRAFSFLIKNEIFDGKIYNILTQNATVREIVDTIREFVPDLQVEFVDNKIMNQLSYEVSCERFKNQGFVFKGDLSTSVGKTIDLLIEANHKLKI
jgi:nucleoside-diphosphate-sugar epimerase